MKMRNILLITLISLGLHSFAQSPFTKKGDAAFNAGLWNEAIQSYQSALKKESKNDLKILITYRIGKSFEQNRDFANAINWYRKVVESGGGFLEKNPDTYLNLANSYKSLESYDEATENFKKYIALVPDDKRGTNGLKSCELAKKWTAEPTRYKVENMRDLNSNANDVAPIFSGKKNDELIFVSYRDGGAGNAENTVTGESFPDLYYTKQDKQGTWSKPVTLNGDVNTKSSEGKATLDNRGNVMYFTRCEENESKKDKDVKGCRIYYSKKKGKGFGDALELDLISDSIAFSVVHPELTPDDQYILFSANAKDGYGGYDLYIAEWDKKAKKWINPKNLGPEINTAGNEFYPYVHKDGTLYFSSNGHIGMGGYDLFKAQKLEDGTYGPVTNLKYPLNTSADELTIIFDGDQEKGYLSSSRPGGRGKMDIWAFVLPPMVITLEGLITNCKNGDLINGAKVTLKGSDGSLEEYVTRNDSAYFFNLSPNNTYTVYAESDEQRKNKFGSDVQKYFKSKPMLIDVIGLEESKTFIQDICLEPIPEEGIELPKILYELGKATLLEESKIRLNSLIEVLEENPKLVIEMGSHTDFRGSNAANQKLSEARAKSAVNYLISKGIQAGRLEFKGYGEEVPYTITEKSAKDVPANMKQHFPVGKVLTEQYIISLKDKNLMEYAHALNRRTEFKVLRTDFNPSTGK